MQVCLLHSEAKIPTLGTPSSAGYDLYCIADQVLVPGLNKIRTGLSIAIPPHTYGRISDRSSMASKSQHVLAGVIDADYRGEVIILMYNMSNDNLIIEKHNRVAQLILEVIDRPAIHVVDTLDTTDRLGGFGSTGK